MEQIGDESSKSSDSVGAERKLRNALHFGFSEATPRIVLSVAKDISPVLHQKLKMAVRPIFYFPVFMVLLILKNASAFAEA